MCVNVCERACVLRAWTFSMSQIFSHCADMNILNILLWRNCVGVEERCASLAR